jgi:transcriptional regulator with XRE-family HTH domain
MKLKDYLKKKRVSQVEYAFRMGVNPITVWRWCSGLPPSISHARWIVQDTKGKVTFDDLMGGNFEQKPVNRSQRQNHHPVG